MDLGLTGKIALVTGSSRGIGRGVALTLAEEGCDVMLTGRDESALTEVVREVEKRGRRAFYETADLRGDGAPAALVEAVKRRFGRLDILVNNAGTTKRGDFLALTDADWQAQWDIHVMAPMRLMRAAIPVMAAAGWGRVVNVSSSSGKRPGQRNVAYSVSKAAELSLSRAYADQYASRGVLVNAVTPGPVASELWLEPGGLVDQTVAARGGTRDDVLEAAAAALPIKRLSSPEEIAAVIVFLCSQAASNVVGAAWSVDGGAVPVII